MRLSRRQILEEHGMTYAPAEALTLFWRSYNARRALTRVGDVATRVMASHAATVVGAMRELADAWASILPESVANSSRVESFRAGRLSVSVDSSATRFVLSRQMGETLVDALNGALKRNVVKRIEFRIERLERGKRQEGLRQ